MNLTIRRRWPPARPLAVAALAVLTVGGPALASVQTGTPNPDVLFGTNGADVLNGGGDDDKLFGFAGNDTYQFSDGWGEDTLEDLRTYRVGGKRKGKSKPGGADTLSFAGVRFGGINARLVPEWVGAEPGANEVFGPGGGHVDLGASVVENIVGTADEDEMAGGGGPNRIATGGGPFDILWDFGGWNDGAGGLPELPPSDDTFVVTAADAALVGIADFGGKADVVDLRPFRLDEVYLGAYDCDSDPEVECLQIVTGPTSQVTVHGQFAPYFENTSGYGQQGQIETLLFADGPVSMTPERPDQEARAGGGGPIGRADTERQRELAALAPDLAKAARKQARAADPSGALRATAAVAGRAGRAGGHDRSDRREEPRAADGNGADAPTADRAETKRRNAGDRVGAEHRTRPAAAKPDTRDRQSAVDRGELHTPDTRS